MIFGDMTTFRDLESTAAHRYTLAFSQAVASVADVREFERWDDATKQALVRMAGTVRPRSLIPEPLLLKPEWATPRVVGALKANALDSQSKSGYQEAGGQGHAPAGRTVSSLLAKLQVDKYVEAQIGIAVEPTYAVSYLLYNTSEAHLWMHLDFRTHSDVNLLLCLDRIDRPGNVNSSSTVAATADAIVSYPFSPGECLIFDGICTPHGRTPVQEGEQIILLAIGLSVKSDSEPRG
jgi:hypothetical protein